VTFDIDANGILHVGAKDKATGKENKSPSKRIPDSRKKKYRAWCVMLKRMPKKTSV
jgi:molecular chaperone DnaK (HSP70)